CARDPGDTITISVVDINYYNWFDVW
nr:immunoglobulin heavy chain junction region [Macaca mulatta]